MSAPTRFEDILARDGVLMYRGVGSSMLPAFRPDKDLMIVIPAARPLKKYDVALYRRPDGRYILHRVVGTRPDGYVMRGDNVERTEYGVADSDVLGVMTAFVRDGKRIEVASPSYRLYARIWTALYPVRKTVKILRRRFSRFVRALLRRDSAP